MSHLLFGDLGKLSEAAREREPEPKVDATIEVLRPYSGRDVFKSDSSQRYEEPLRTTVGPLTYNTVNRGVQASTCDASSTFNSKTLTGGGVAANMTTANVDFVTDHPRKHANTRASASRAFGNPTMSCSPAVSSYRPTYRAPSIVRSLGRSVSRLENLSASPGRSLSSSGRSTTTYSSRATTRDVERCAVVAVVARASRASPGSRGGAGMIASTTAERDETKTTTGR